MNKRFLEWPDAGELEQEVWELASDVAEREVAPRAAAHDLEGTFVRDSIDALAEAGLLGVNVPKQYGGLGGGELAAMMALEAVSAACGSTGACLLFHYLTTHLIKEAGPEELRQKYLPDLARKKLGAFSLNEMVDLALRFVETTVEDRGDHYRVNGLKPFVTSAGVADVYVCYAHRVDVDVPVPQLNQVWMLIDRPAPGVSTPVIHDPMGLRGASNGQMKYDNVKIPKENMIGEQPWAGLRAGLTRHHTPNAPQVVGMGLARAALEAAVAHTRNKDLPTWMIQQLGTMSDRLAALRAFHVLAARNLAGDFEPSVRWQDELLRLGGNDMYWICDKAIEIVGGSSLMRRSPIQRYYRDARVTAFLMLAMEARRERVGQQIVAHQAAAERDESTTMPWDPFADHSYRNSRSLFDIGIINLPAPARTRVLQALSRRAVEGAARANGMETITLEFFIDQLQQVFARMQAQRPEATAASPPGRS